MFQKRKVLDCDVSKWRIFLPLSLSWLVTVAISLFLHRDDIATLRFNDPDDTMRLLEVRDFLAGQSWFDVSQHRSNPPLGGPMHWSRLVDLPIAGIILLLRPLLGSHAAEVGAVLIIPALTLATLLYALYWAVCPLLRPGRALLCCAAFAISPFIAVQCAAMRIDHHAWQAVMMALTLGGTLHFDTRKGGAIAGLAIAVWLQISIEGLAFAALTGAVMAVRYVLNAEEWPRFTAYLWAMVIASVTLLVLTRGWWASQVSYCDSLSPVYLAPLAVLPPLITGLYRMVEQNTTLGRLRSVTLAVGTSIAIFLGVGKQCFVGPFATLDPVVYKIWYMGISEGLPIWMQDTDTALAVVLPPLIGTTGYALAWYGERHRPQRFDWMTLFIFAAGAMLLSLFVMRTGFIAHLVAIPGAAWLTVISFKRARALSSASSRIPATVISIVLLFPIAFVPLISSAFQRDRANTVRSTTARNPVGEEEVAVLEQLAPITVFAPVDISPSIMLRTSNAVVSTGHHRNAESMKLVVDAFLASPQDARTIVLRSSAMYLVFAPMGETYRYRAFAPQGLAAQLMQGKHPDWLVPIFLPGLKVLSLYRIDREDPAQRIMLSKQDK